MTICRAQLIAAAFHQLLSEKVRTKESHAFSVVAIYIATVAG